MCPKTQHWHCLQFILVPYRMRSGACTSEPWSGIAPWLPLSQGSPHDLENRPPRMWRAAFGPNLPSMVTQWDPAPASSTGHLWGGGRGDWRPCWGPKHKVTLGEDRAGSSAWCQIPDKPQRRDLRRHTEGTAGTGRELGRMPENPVWIHYLSF